MVLKCRQQVGARQRKWVGEGNVAPSCNGGDRRFRAYLFLGLPKGTYTVARRCSPVGTRPSDEPGRRVRPVSADDHGSGRQRQQLHRFWNLTLRLGGRKRVSIEGPGLFRRGLLQRDTATSCALPVRRARDTGRQTGKSLWQLMFQTSVTSAQSPRPLSELQCAVKQGGSAGRASAWLPLLGNPLRPQRPSSALRLGVILCEPYSRACAGATPSWLRIQSPKAPNCDNGQSDDHRSDSGQVQP